jgi:hypothetical protein
MCWGPYKPTRSRRGSSRSGGASATPIALNLDDYFDIRKGGDDTVTAGAGADTIYAGAALNAGDQIAAGSQVGPGPTEIDTLILSGVYAAPVVFNANTVTGVEAFEIEQGSKVSLVLHNNTVTSAFVSF